MNTDRDYLAAGLALGGLSEAELAEAQTLADTDTDFRSEVAAYADTMALMAESEAEASESSATDAPEPISAATRNAILAIPSTHAQEDAAANPQGLDQAESEQQQAQSSAPTQLNAPAQPASQTDSQPSSDVPPPADLAEHRRKRRPWVSMAAAAAAVIVAAGVGVSSWQKQNELEDDLAAAQQQLDDSARLMEAGDLKTSTAELPEGGSVTVVSSEKEQLIRLSPRDVEVSPSGKSLQMWVIGDAGPESVGLMTKAPVTIADEPFAKGSLFGVTVEPKGGSDQPTTDPIVAIGL
ncbi:anti-sigma factor [Brevibacterium sp. UCMA 11752]|uniref:anti-sigma factor n=1 Tax=Brevibacterium sp. UCMA 11752 TaxID=2745946 RepID=UPI001F291B72|nr:anti-sigma factor [Brevibacterium sp. UCMA 11752]MCF2586547.1 anti-sigma factor [Brevibacterium sp. UCMA 11752]